LFGSYRAGFVAVAVPLALSAVALWRIALRPTSVAAAPAGSA